MNMNLNLNKLVSFSIILLFLFACFPIPAASTQYVIDVYNPAELVGDVDYVFVAQVDESVQPASQIGGIIERIKCKFKKSRFPEIVYSVTVLENIKGELISDQPILIKKAAGINKNGTIYLTHESDSLPEVGKVYIFLAYAQPDGTLQVSGPNSNIELGFAGDLKDPDSIKESSEYLKMVDAYENQIVRERENFISKYDVKFEE